MSDTERREVPPLPLTPDNGMLNASMAAWHSWKARDNGGNIQELARLMWEHMADDWQRAGAWRHAAALSASVQQEVKPSEDAAARDVLAERKRQTEKEGWTPEHDDEHREGEMAMAAACYAAHSSTSLAIEYGLDSRNGIFPKLVAAQDFVGRMWPWGREWWKPKDTRRDLARAGALILAEIERLDRAALAAEGKDKL